MTSRQDRVDSTGNTRPGGRSARVREAVQAAARAELRDKGFEGLPIV